MTKVTLAWYEYAMASEQGRLRQMASIRAGRLDQHGFEGCGWDAHIEGACGEQAVAKCLNIYWSGGVDVFKADDLPGIQVRTRSLHSYDLIVRPCDPDDTIWVLVTGRCPSYDVRGWILGSAAKQDRWLRTHGNRPPAFFVPAAELAHIDTLPIER
jgi:hypothetical protein